jgi:hypothetical protein
MSGVVVFGVIVILAFILTPFSLILTIPAAIVVGFFLWHTFALAEVAIVARNGTIGDGIVEGWELVTRNKVNCLIVTVLMIGIGIGFAIAIGLITLVAFLPVGIAVGLMTGNIVATLILGLVIALPISMVLGGFTGTFFNALYVQFYFKLYEPAPVPAATAPAV